MPAREEEIEAENRLQDFLLKCGLASDWTEVSVDPPDLCFTVNGKPWGVEVTRLFQYVEWGGQEKNFLSLLAPAKRVLEQVWNSAGRGNGLEYTVLVSGPPIPDWSKISDRAADYMKCGRTGKCSLDTAGHIWIEAQAGSRELACIPFLDGTSKIPGSEKPPSMIADVMATLRYSVRRILEMKLPRLKKVVGYESKFLLIISEYFFADQDRVSQVLSEHSLSTNDLDSIFLLDSASGVTCVADPGGLFSKDSEAHP